MRLVRIKNRYLFKGNNPNGTHTYATYYDRQNKRYNAVQLTHLYVKDANRFRQVQRGNIMITKFKEFDVPSGVRNQYYNKCSYCRQSLTICYCRNKGSQCQISASHQEKTTNSSIVHGKIHFTIQ